MPEEVAVALLAKAAGLKVETVRDMVDRSKASSDEAREAYGELKGVFRVGSRTVPTHAEFKELVRAWHTVL